MEELDYNAFVERYQSLPADELLRLYDRKAELLPLAQQALAHEVSKRRVQIEALKEAQATDKATALALDAKQIQIKSERQVREDRRYKWYMIALVPIVAFMFIWQSPEESWGPGVLGLSVLLLYWTVVLVRWLLAAKKKQPANRDA